MIWKVRAALREALAALRKKEYEIAYMDILEALEMLDESFEIDKKPWCWP